jgi:hypothetical protein
VFGRRSAPDSAGDQTEADRAEAEANLGKGRATPKRAEAQAARKKRMAPPRSRKEANALRRERMKEQRLKQRLALSGGDDKYLPPKDQGPVKKYIRDYVDSRRTIGEFLIPAFVVVFFGLVVLSSVAPSAPYAGSVPWLVVMGALAFDSVRILRGVKQGIAERFGVQETKGIAFYTLMRSWQMRRLRLPKAKVRRGAEI